MITCQSCKQVFDLNDAPGAAGVTQTGDYIGECPYCGYCQDVVIRHVTHSDQEVANIVEVLELASDNLCQRVFDLMMERGWKFGERICQ